jgi:hypothetical protein
MNWTLIKDAFYAAALIGFVMLLVRCGQTPDTGNPIDDAHTQEVK